MASLDDLFSTEKDDIEIKGVDSLAQLCKYHPQKKGQFFSGLTLAEDLVNDKGVTLYTQGTNVTPDRIARLYNLSENNPNMVIDCKIKRSAELINNFRGDILLKMTRLVDVRKNYKVYSSMIGTIAEEIKSFVTEIMSDENIVLAIYKMKFAAESSSNKNMALFFNHTVSVALFSYAISQSKGLKEEINFTKEDLNELLKAAFFHNMGAIMDAESIVNTPEEDRKKKYYDANRNSAYMLKNVQLSFEAMDAIRYVCEYNFDRMDFVEREDNKGCWMANIIVIADRYVQLETGFLGQKQKPSHIVDQLNVMVVEKKLNEKVVKAITLGLNLNDIFDFYQEMRNLREMCNFKGGNHAIPYPITGFKSPTICVCKSDMNGCEHFEHSVKAVSLVKKVGELSEGKYARCLLTTRRLLEFYESHYEDIKKELKTVAKDK